MPTRPAGEHGSGGEDLQNCPAEKARQGDIILREQWQRIAFVAGLAGSLVLLLVLLFLGWR